MKIAVVSHSYMIETSPIVKDICRYLVAQGFNVDIHIDDSIRSPQFNIPGANIIKAGNPVFLRMLRFITSMRGIGVCGLMFEKS